MTALVVAAVLAAALLVRALLGSPNDPVAVLAPSPQGAAATACSALVRDAPATVDGQSSRPTTPGSPFTAAWGDPAILLRCGVDRPPSLSASSQCFVIDGIGWLATQDGREVVDQSGPGTLTFTTIGRSAYVEVQVPDHYQPASNALVDLTRTIRNHTSQIRGCV